MTTGQIIKQLRKEKEMSQETLAERMGYSHKSSINKIEMGKADLPQSKLMALAEIFNVSPCVLLGYDEPATNKDFDSWEEKFNPNDKISKEDKLFEQIQNLLGDDAHKLLLNFCKLNEIGKKKILNEVSDMTELSKYIEFSKKESNLA